MCWTQGVSVAFGIAGVASAIYKTKKSKDKRIRELTVPLFYFSLMEILHFFSYFYINECGLYQNQFLTFLSYVHICLQPIFFNMMYMYFIPIKVKNKIQSYVYGLSFLMCAFMFMRLIPFQGSAICTSGQLLCGQNFCSMSGNWHIAWEVPLYNLPIIGHIPNYFLAVFVLPLLYGSWRALLVGSIFGPVVAYLSTTNQNEMPAIWCLFSVFLFLVVMNTRFINLLKVNKWILWKKI